MNNLFRDMAADLPDEIYETLLTTSHVRIERIVSQGHASPPDFWYDQEQNEWVLLVQGSARLRFEDTLVEMQPGDFVNIPAHQRHRSNRPIQLNRQFGWRYTMQTNNLSPGRNPMPSEIPFRIALFLVMSVAMTIGVYHRWKAASSGERISHKEEGYLFAIVLRSAGLFLWLSTFAYLLYPTVFQWASIPLPPRFAGAE